MKARFFLALPLLVTLVLGSFPQHVQAADDNEIVIALKVLFPAMPDRLDGKETITGADGKKYEITVYSYKNTVTNAITFTCIVKDLANDDPSAVTYAKLFPNMGIPLACITYSGSGADRASAVKSAEDIMVNYVGDKLTIAITNDGPEGAARFVMKYKK